MPRVYIETSIVSYLRQRPSAQVVAAARQVLTRRWWDDERGEGVIAEVFGPLSRYAPLRGLLSVAVDPRSHGGSDGVQLLTRTSAGGITLTVVWIVVLVSVSGAIFSRSEVR